MARINLAGVPDDGIATIPETLLIGTFIVPSLPGHAEAVETDLGGGLTKVSAPIFGPSGVFEIIVKNYEAGLHTFPGEDPEVMLTGGVVKSVKIIGTRVQEADQLNIDVEEFLPKVEAFTTGTDPDAMIAHVMGLNWTILGRSAADAFDWDKPTLGFDAALLFTGNDRFFTKGGADTVFGYDGNDLLNTGAGNDTAYGGAGNDTLRGLGGRDKLFGGTGRDNLQGGDKKDVLKGGAGRDILDGGKHNDKLFGGAGPDTFLFVPNAGADTIMDFELGKDKIRLDNVSGISITETATGLRITHTGGTIDVFGLSDGDLTPADIMGW